MSVGEVDAETAHDGELVDALEGYTVEVEDVLTGIDVGDAGVECEDAAFAE